MGEIAIVGVGCRLPGGISDLAGLWEALIQGRDLVTSVPADRFEAERFTDARMARPGKSYTAAGGFLDDIAGFDAGFFGISPKEAEQVDPQHRLLLETAVEALDDAGIDPGMLAGSDTGVFVGVSDMGYGGLQLIRPAQITAYTMSGAASSIAANRVSHFLDLRGPSMAIDTACSSSLVALERACAQLASGGSRVALAGGVNVLLNPSAYVGFSQAGMLSRRGRCAAFSAHADGFVRAEGAGMVVLKPLADALADGDRVHGVIAGFGSNCDGRTMGLALPSAEAQEDLLRQVYRRAGILPDEVAYVEAHGTGTLVGDPAECAALGEALAAGRSVGALPIGSVKSNLGHLEPASGMAGLLKALLVLRHATVPASLHLDPLNPAIDFEGLGLEPVGEPRPLQNGGGRRFVGVNSFGFGGANAHVVIGPSPDGPRAQTARGTAGPRRALPVVASGHTEQAAEQAAERLADRLAEAMPQEFYDIAYTATRRRGWQRYRKVVLADSPHEAAQGLAEAPVRKAAERGRVGLVFAGNGSQWPGMGADLLASDAVFRAEVEAVDAALAPHLGWSVIGEMGAPADRWRLAETEIAQPLLFAVQAGLAAMLHAHGLRPALALGHSVGEIAAAYTAGALTLDQAARVVAERSRAQAPTAGTGRMAAAGLSREQAGQALARYPEVEIAAINSARDLTLAGPQEQLKALGDELEPRGIFFRLLDLDYAFHSAAMEPARASLEAGLHDLSPAGGGNVELASTVTGGPVTADQLDAEHWWRNIRNPVLFAEAVEYALETGVDVLVEVGPHPVLHTYLQRITRERDQITTTATMHRQHGSAVREAIADLIAAGAPFEWERFFPHPGRVAELPGYPWQRERHWSGTPQAWAPRIGSGRLDHRLLGERLEAAEPSWSGPIEPALAPWLVDHKLSGSVVFPATAYVEMALAAGQRVLGGPAELRWLEVSQPLVIAWDRAGDVGVQLTLSPADGRVTITSTDRTMGGEPRPQVRAQVRNLIGRRPGPLDVSALRARCPRSIDAADLYATAAAAGAQYGPAFQELVDIRIGEGEVLAAYRHPGGPGDLEPYVAHPALLDGAVHAGTPLVADRLAAGELFLPAAIGAVRVWRSPAAEGMVHVRDRTTVATEVCWDITVTDPDGTVTIELAGLRLRRIANATGRAPARQDIVLRAAPHPDLPAARSPLGDSGALVTAAAADIERAREDWRALPYDRFQEQLKGTSAHHAAVAFAGLLPDPAAVFTVADLVAGGMRPDLAGFAELTLVQLDRYGLAERAGPGRWRLAGTPRPHELGARALLDFPAFSELVLAARQVRHLPRTLRGEQDPLELLVADGSADHFEHFYDVAPVNRFHNRLAAALLRQIAAAWPADRPLRILEVGAGTGGVTAALLPVLPPERTRYTFTDVSAAFLARAGQRFAGYDFVEYHTLDLDSDLAGQGWLQSGYDVVVAANSLHTAADLTHALHQVRGLLAPGGRLLAVEAHDPEMLLPLFGTLAGFWGHSDRELRARSLLVPRDRWPDLLADCGFGDVVQLGDDRQPARDDLSVLLATAPDRTAAPAGLPAADGGRWILAGETPDQADLARTTAALLTACGATAAAPVTAVADVRRWTALLEEHAGQDGELGVVLLLGGGDRLCGSALVEQATARAAILRALVLAGQSLPRDVRLTVWLVTRPSGALPAPERPDHPEDAAAWGLARSLANEIDITLMKLSLHRLGDPAEDARRLARELLARHASLDEPGGEAVDDEIVLTAGGRFVPRYREQPVAARRLERSPFTLSVHNTGLLYRPAWAAAEPAVPAPGLVVIEVRAAALNYRDIMQVTGLLPAEAIEGTDSEQGPGLECAGVITAVGRGVHGVAVGDRVAAVAPASLGSHTVTVAHAVIKIPDQMSFAEAATMPVAFGTVHYALGDLAHLGAGQTILIHGAAGGVGLAALQFARTRGARVIATAGSQVKRDFLHAFGVEHVLDSRTLDFAPQVMAITADRGVDVVVNSLGGQAIDRSLELLAPGGRFIELGKRDIFESKPLLMRPFRKNLAFFGVDLTAVCGDPALGAELLRAVAQRLQDGTYRPLPHTVYPADRVAEAFTLMQHSRHIGKVVVSFDPDRPPAVEAPPATLRLDPDGTYLVTGGLGGFGAATARRLADHGARHLALVGRRGAGSPEASALLADLTARGVHATAHAVDVTDAAAMGRLLGHIDGTGHRLAGVVHAAMVLDDQVLGKLTDEQVRAVLAPKMAGADVLDALTSDVDLFVLYSSFAGHLGSPGQTAYSAANLFTEALARRRRHEGRAGLAVAWGHIADRGYVARNNLSHLLETLGFEPISADSALRALPDLIADGTLAAGVGRYTWARTRTVLPALGARRFTEVVPQDGQGEHTRRDLLETLAGATPQEAEQIVIRILTEALAGILHMDADRIEPGRPVTEYGVDSLSIAELLGGLRQHYDIDIPPLELLNSGGTLVAVAHAVLLRLGVSTEADSSDRVGP